MNMRIVSPLLFLAFFAMSCNDSEKHKHDENIAIELDNGKKWDVNNEMRPFIVKGEAILSQYSDGNYLALAEQLETQNKGLVKSCTMDGKSHDELHKWLHPHMTLVKELGVAESEEEASGLISRLQESFKSYNQFFQ